MAFIPRHVAIIPDGNRRWAKSKGMPVYEGHKAAMEQTVPALIEKAARMGIQYLTFWALSTENYYKRSKEEVDTLLKFGSFFLKKRLSDMAQKGVRICCIGDLSKLPSNTQEIIQNAVDLTKNNSTITFIIALNYGGRNEMLRAVQKLVKDGAEITEEVIAQSLDTVGVPDPDLVIRTGGEQRLSGFMPWQTIYSELYFSSLMFPDFGEMELEKAVEEFGQRQRRFGK